MSYIDSVDEQLLQALRKDGRQSSKAISHTVHISPATIRRRIGRLVENDVIRIVPVVDPAKLGRSLAANIFLDVEREKVDAVAQTLSEMPEIKWIAVTTGRFNILALGFFGSTDELYDFLQRRAAGEGVRASETFICLRIKKGRFVGV